MNIKLDLAVLNDTIDEYKKVRIAYEHGRNVLAGRSRGLSTGWDSSSLNVKNLLRAKTAYRAQFDPGRELDNSLTKIYYFNNEGNLEFSLRRFPQDKVTLVASGERIDITNASFLGAQGSASAYFQDRIIDNLEGAGS